MNIIHRFFSVAVTHTVRHGKLSFQVCAVTRNTRHCSRGYTLPLALALYILGRLTTGKLYIKLSG